MIFSIAALYNSAFGSWAVLFPTAFFSWFDLGPPSHPWIWSCLGMVIGVYGLGFVYVACRPEHGDIIAALGLLGKLLGPIGWLIAMRQGEIPPRTYPLILANDLVWWFPFIAYLLRRMQQRRMVLAMMAVAFHAAACAMLLIVRNATEVQPDFMVRRMLILGSAPSWTICWFLWSIASLSVMSFFAIWAAQLRDLLAPFHWVVAGCSLCATGLLFDLASEIIAIVKLTDPKLSVLDFESWAKLSSILGAGVANCFYCIGGIAMSIVSWRNGFQRGIKAILAALVWLSGLALSAAAISHQGNLMAIAGAALMILFIPWAALTGVDFRAKAMQDD